MDTAVKIFGIKVYEKRSVPVSTGTLADPSETLINAVTKAMGNNAIGGVNVNIDSALSLSAVWRAMNLISGTLAGLPLKVYKSEEGVGRVPLKKHVAAKVLRRPNNFMTGYIFRETLQAHILGYGNAYAYIKRNQAGEPVEIVPVHPNDCNVFKDQDKLWYIIRIDNIYQPAISSENMIHVPGLGFNGIVGFSPIAIARESLGGAIATQRFGNKFYENGANIGGVLETPGTLTEEAYNRLKVSWAERQQGLNNSHKPAILEGGLKYTKIGIAPEEAQFLQTRKFQVAEIARWFGTPPHLLMDLEMSTNNNIEHQGMSFVTYTLLPWANRWEEELNLKLIKTSDQDDLYFEHEFNGLLRADSKSRAEYYRSLFSIATINPNHIAELENLPMPTNGDKYYVQGAYVPTDKIDDFYKSKAGKTNEVQ